jgi:hypothetical protein
VLGIVFGELKNLLLESSIGSEAVMLGRKPVDEFVQGRSLPESGKREETTTCTTSSITVS